MRSILLLSFAICLWCMGFSQATPLPATEVQIYNAYRINSAEYEFSPMYFQKGIVYVTARTTLSDNSKKTNTPFFELYYAPFASDGMPNNQYPFSSPSSSLGNEGQASFTACLLYTSPSPRDLSTSRMPSSA